MTVPNEPSEAHDEAMKELRRDLMRFEALPPQSPEAVWEWAQKANAHIHDLLRSATPANARAVAKNMFDALVEAGIVQPELRRQGVRAIAATLPEAPPPVMGGIASTPGARSGVYKDKREHEAGIHAPQSATARSDPEAAWYEWRAVNPDGTMYEAFMHAASLRSETPAIPFHEVERAILDMDRDQFLDWLEKRRTGNSQPMTEEEKIVGHAPNGNDNETGGAR
jgi:hypothetical protein